MARPRKADVRDHQINLRFTAPELVRIHQHAAISGKTVTDFGRSVLLRRPRRRTGKMAMVIAWPEATLGKWHHLGTRLNAIAHTMNARADDLPPDDLGPLVAALCVLFKQSLAALIARDPAPAYALAPAVRHHLRKVGVNLAQIRTRFDRLGVEPPIALVRLLARIRTLLNGDRAPDGS